MKLAQQKWWRFIIPGVMLYGLLVIFCWTTKWCDLPIPTTYLDVTKLLVSLVLGFMYSVSGLRELSNNFYHKRVNINIRDILVEPFLKTNPELEQIKWKELRHIFYQYVDHDKSLEKKSEIIRWNGVLWTSVADLRACSIIGVLCFSVSVICGYNLSSLAFDFGKAGYPITGLVIIFLLSFFFSSLITEKHRRLGREQCEYIILHYKDDLLKKLEAAVETKNERS